MVRTTQSTLPSGAADDTRKNSLHLDTASCCFEPAPICIPAPFGTVYFNSWTYFSLRGTAGPRKRFRSHSALSSPNQSTHCLSYRTWTVLLSTQKQKERPVNRVKNCSDESPLVFWRSPLIPRRISRRHRSTRTVEASPQKNTIFKASCAGTEGLTPNGPRGSAPVPPWLMLRHDALLIALLFLFASVPLPTEQGGAAHELMIHGSEG